MSGDFSSSVDILDVNHILDNTLTQVYRRVRGAGVAVGVGLGGLQVFGG